MSPSSMMVEETEVGYMLVAENNHCGTRKQLLSSEANLAEDCAALAQGAGVKAFSLRTHHAQEESGRVTTSSTSTCWCRWLLSEAASCSKCEHDTAASARCPLQ